ncbi:MAG: mechanosensitive ion channel family protein [Kiritimatiellae bacterium]|nr:mechanosensitive ion channel family protein [Kiritimatiellia bacterium]
MDFIVNKLLPSAVVLGSAFGGNYILKKILNAALGKVKGGSLDITIKKILIGASTTLVYIVAVLMVLDIFGVNIASILTIVGALGLAIGLALKDTLSNIASGLMIVVLRPFKVDDYVECGSVSGTVNSIGLFTTKLTTADGVFVEAPNSILWGNVPTKNYTRNPIRRIDIPVGVAYEDSINEAMKVLLSIAEQDPRTQTTSQPPAAFVNRLDDSSVNLVLRVWVDRTVYWDVLHDLSREVKLGVEKANFTIAFPQCDVHIKNNP